VSISASLPDLYRATATVLVEAQHVSEELVRSSVSAELETRIQTIREQVMSRERLGALISRLGLYPELRARGVAFDAIIERMRRDIELDLNTTAASGARTPTIAFAIRYSGRNPRTVADVANMLASVYVVENSKIREGQAVRTAEFLKTQLDAVKRELDEQERRATEFNLSHIGELPQQVAANLASLERLNTQLRLNGENQVRAMDRRERLERQLTELPPSQAATSTSDPARTGSAELTKLKQELEQLRRKYTDHYPAVIRLRDDCRRRAATRRTAGHRERRREHCGQGAGGLHRSTRLLQAIAARRQAQRAQKRRGVVPGHRVLRTGVENVPKRQEEFSALPRYGPTKERYETLLKRARKHSSRRAWSRAKVEPRSGFWTRPFRRASRPLQAVRGSSRSDSSWRWRWRSARPSSWKSSTRRSTASMTCARLQPFRRCSASR
jgi:uncharacterized protein involved in exopolysaccharide biosynthesis